MVAASEAGKLVGRRDCLPGQSKRKIVCVQRNQRESVVLPEGLKYISGQRLGQLRAQV